MRDLKISVNELIRHDFLAFPVSQNILKLIKGTAGQQFSYVFIMDGQKVISVISTLDLYRSMSVPDANLATMRSTTEFAIISVNDDISALTNLNKNFVVVFGDNHQPVGFIDNLQMIVSLLNLKHLSCSQKQSDFNEFENIVYNLEEEIFVTDGKGNVLFLNPAAEKVCGFTKEEVIGKHVTYLEKEHMISSSISMIVLKTREKVVILQQVKTGKTVLGTAVPIFDKQGELIRVLCTSKDVAQINNLFNKIDRQHHELKAKDRQLNVMSEGLFGHNNYACFSKGLEAIKEILIKIAPTDLTVLIQGESGVGKEVAAKLIHSLSPRNKYPLVKINCGLIPEALIESELFGYDKGAFTGANTNGKIGKIELADQGTLFLDEIGEMPLLQQVKLLEFIQDREITRIGGSKRIGINTRIITATNRDLKDMVKQGEFREDLYYRLNVFPLRIAPLRERIEDISTFTEYFLQKFNDKYKLYKELDPDVLDILAKYDWPGNVRELEHVIERIIVCSSADLVTTADLNNFLDLKQQSRGRVNCTGLLPWKAAKKELEEQLIKRAYDFYKSTYKAANALEVSQSTVAKVMKNMDKYNST